MRGQQKVNLNISLWDGQQALIEDTKKLNHVYFGGVGHGKTVFGARWLAARNLWNRKSVSKKSAILAPTYRLLEHHMLPYFKAALEEMGMRENLHYSLNKKYLILEYNKDLFPYQVFFLSADYYQHVVAWEFDCAWWDEPGFSPIELKQFIDTRVGRAAGTSVGQVLHTGVVQIANWYYENFGAAGDLAPISSYELPPWVERYAPDWGGRQLVRHRESKTALVLHASSFENPTLRPDYFDRLWTTYGYDQRKFEAQVIGLGVAINKNSVYDCFEEKASVGSYKVDHQGFNPVLNLCFDFNVGQMTALVVQEYSGSHYVVWENGVDCKITEDACREFIKAFPVNKFGNRFIRVFGDSSGYARNAQLRTKDGSYSIIKAILSAEGYSVEICSPRYTVPQETRVMTTNRLHAQAARRDQTPGLYADKKCRKLINGWRVVAWDQRTGKIKKGGDDTTTHAPEAIDYYLYRVDPPVIVPTSAGV